MRVRFCSARQCNLHQSFIEGALQYLWKWGRSWMPLEANLHNCANARKVDVAAQIRGASKVVAIDRNRDDKRRAHSRKLMAKGEALRAYV